MLASQDIAQLTDTEIIGFHRHLPPLRLTRMDWRRYPLWRQRRAIPPPPVPELAPLTEIPRELSPFRDEDVDLEELLNEHDPSTEEQVERYKVQKLRF